MRDGRLCVGSASTTANIARLVASPKLALLLHSPDLVGVEVGEGAA